MTSKERKKETKNKQRRGGKDAREDARRETFVTKEAYYLRLLHQCTQKVLQFLK